jgi:predicted HTH transcriptional regulator
MVNLACRAWMKLSMLAKEESFNGAIENPPILRFIEIICAFMNDNPDAVIEGVLVEKEMVLPREEVISA